MSLRETQAFFASRAAGWEERFPDDEPRYVLAVRSLAIEPAATVLDAGCGTGRALPILRRAVGIRGRVIGLDATPEMLAEAARRGRGAAAGLVLGDGNHLPFRTPAFGAILSAGYVPHLDSPQVGLRELARVAIGGARLAIFHPIGRAALAARHGGHPSEDDPLSPVQLPGLLESSGWRLESLDDGDDRYLALAVRA
ncbi:MAG: methyltransferase domain-containing protein [Chloroflexi bacterium]|nr:methyltransferase domain-containing protein [Chloroflexota bacterium]